MQCVFSSPRKSVLFTFIAIFQRPVLNGKHIFGSNSEWGSWSLTKKLCYKKVWGIILFLITDLTIYCIPIFRTWLISRLTSIVKLFSPSQSTIHSLFPLALFCGAWNKILEVFFAFLIGFGLLWINLSLHPLRE